MMSTASLTDLEMYSRPELYPSVRPSVGGACVQHTSAKILIIDDEQTNLFLMEDVLENAGFTSFRSTTDPFQVLSLFMTYQPDLILLDLHMPHLDGFTVLQQLLPRIPEGAYLPVLILSGETSPVKRRKALAMGAKDFIGKPYDVAEILLRLNMHLQTRFLNLELQEKTSQLEQKIRERTQELEEAQVEILERLAMAAEYRDDNTGRHTQRVGNLSALIAKKLGLPDVQVERIRRAAPLHDVGKIGLPDGLLLKSGTLEAQEYDLMKEHIVIGARILSGSNYPLLQMAEEIAFSHHLRWDGTGYPINVKGEDIPLSGRIVAVADVFDALVHKRPYKDAWALEEAVDEIKRQSGVQFDPQVVEAFLLVIAEKGPEEVKDWIAEINFS